jgi:cytochrome c oxidase subunit 1
MTGLEWQTPSPPPKYNFDKTPVVKRKPYDFTVKGKARPQNA